MAADIGMKLMCELWGDSTAAKGVANRLGVGKIRHLHLPLLWIQSFVKKGLLKLIKKKGTELSADLGTKLVTSASMWKHLSTLNFELRHGQSEKALKAAV